MATDPHANANYERTRYRHDPAYRLRRINHTRRMRGMPTIASLAEVETRGPPA